MKRCTYCPLEHHRRGRACSDYCERKTRGLKQSVTYHRRRAVDQLMAAIRKREQYNRRWRNIAFGRDEQTNLLAVFGTTPADTINGEE